MTQPTPTLRDLFETALALAPGERAAYLDAQCRDIAQRDAVLHLLAADAAGDAHLLDRPFDDMLGRVADVAAESPELPRGSRVGPFTLLDKLGEGGSAIVYRAEREQAGVRQVVALKLLRRGLHAEDEQRRFRDERRALTQLRHPGIAHLIEGGVTGAGVPYIALELVDGEPITGYARNRHLDLRQRLLLFVGTCRAVEAAHRALIVHRDLKPSNVMVTREGEVKLLDFGIAKLLDADADGAHTRHQVMTPAYAAPEQFSFGQITTATDVYALGVLLGELISGTRREHGDAFTPSSRVSEDAAPGVLPAAPKTTRRALRGDLDNIVLKATMSEPEHRYTSAGAFADDIERHLNRQPVLAHPPSRWYRARKFVTRHRGGVVTTAAFLLAILAALGLALWQAQVARNEAIRANTVRDFVVGLFDAARAHLPRDQRPTPEALVEQAQRQLTDSANLDAATRADVLRTLGEVSLSLANFARAETLFAEAQALASGTGDESGARISRALHADALQRAGRNADAIREAQALLDDLHAAPSPALLRADAVLASAEMATGKPDAAIAHRREAAATADRLYDPGSTEALAVAFEVGNTLGDAQRYPEAITVLTPLLTRWRASHAAEDDRYVAALASLATASDGVGDLPAGEARFRELLALQKRIYTAPHDAIASTLRDLGQVVVRAERYAEAETLLNEALAMQRQVFGDDHREMAATYDALGEVMVGQRRFAEADADYGAAIAICERAQIKEEVCPRARNNLGMSLYRQNRLDEAKQEMTQALAERRALFGNDHATVAYSLSTLANVAVKQDDSAEGVRLSGAALDVLERGGRGASREATLIRNGYAQALWLAKRNDDALREIDRSLVDWQRLAPDGKVRRAMMLAQKAQILRDLARADDARRTAEEAIAIGAKPAELSTRTKQLLRELSGRNDIYPDAATSKQ